MSEWLAQPLGALATVQKGRKVETSKYLREGFAPYLGASAISGVIEEYGDTRIGVMSASGDVLMLWDGERSGLVGKAQAGVISSTVARLSPKTDVDGEYLYYVLDSKFEWIQGRRTGTGVPHVPKDLVRILSIPYPRNKNEQRRIAEILSTLDEAIEQSEALIAKHQQIKAGLMHDLFTRGVTPDGHLRPTREQVPDLYKESPLGWIPKEWEMSSCSDICISIIDCKNRTPPIAADGHPVIRTPNVRDGEFVWIDLIYTDPDSYEVWTARGKPQAGDIVITREAPVGEACMIPESLQAPCLGQRMMLYRPNPEQIHAAYMLYALQSPRVRKHLDVISGGSTVGHVKVGEIRSLRLPCPRLEEQKIIAQALDAVRSQHNHENERCAKLRKQKHGLMHDLLTGRVQVQPLPSGERENLGSTA